MYNANRWLSFRCLTVSFSFNDGIHWKNFASAFELADTSDEIFKMKMHFLLCLISSEFWVLRNWIPTGTETVFKLWILLGKRGGVVWMSAASGVGSVCALKEPRVRALPVPAAVPVSFEPWNWSEGRAAMARQSRWSHSSWKALGHAAVPCFPSAEVSLRHVRCELGRENSL